MTLEVEPMDVIHDVDSFIRKARRDAENASNVELLDSSQAWELHQLAARIYRLGWSAGHAAATVTRTT